MSTRVAAIVALIIALLISFFTSSEAQGAAPPPAANIKGIVVTNVAGALTPVAGAKVVLKRGSVITQETTTNAAGEFAFARVAPGVADVIARKPAVGVDARHVILKPGEDQKARLILTKP